MFARLSQHRGKLHVSMSGRIFTRDRRTHLRLYVRLFVFTFSLSLSLSLSLSAILSFFLFLHPVGHLMTQKGDTPVGTTSFLPKSSGNTIIDGLPLLPRSRTMRKRVVPGSPKHTTRFSPKERAFHHCSRSTKPCSSWEGVRYTS